MATGSESLFAVQESAAAAGSVYVRVAVERGIEIDWNAEKTAEGLTYRLDGPLASTPPTIGERVEVPLGRGTGVGKLTSGIVVAVGGPELLDGLAPSKVKPVARRSGAALPPRMVELAEWMATYYVCPLGMVIASMIPAAVKQGIGRREVEQVSLLPGAFEHLKPPQRKLLEQVRALPADVFPLPLASLAAKLNLKTPQRLRALIAAGALHASITEEVHARENLSGDLGVSTTAITPTRAQQAIIDAIAPTLSAFHAHLLHGVTGSGKTEVYLRLIAKVLERGQSAIVLVPEIALTPQTADRFTARFGKPRVAVLHSGLTAAQRNREWSRAAAGQAQVVVGARSAVFAPVPNLGLIVVDEEHDSSYKQDRLPRYNARDVAIKRAQLEPCPVLLGSATPALESYANATSGSPKWSLWELTERVGNARLPDVEIVDLREERRLRAQLPLGDDGRLHLLGPTLEQALEHTLADGAQAILLLNRRGFAHYINCPKAACGFSLACSDCDANLVLHRHSGVPAGELVRCHHCLAEQLVPRLCPQCGTKLNVFGGGTQRAEDELIRKFTSMGLKLGETLLRLDSDSMRSARDYYDALSRFAKGEARVLIGTQMIAKGLDYPNVRLVGVLDADTSLNIPDFRASERTFQLVSQVAGRAGRGDKPGRVIIQTMNPDAPPILLAAAHDYVTFAREELATRQRSRLPPAARMARIVCRDEDDKKARDRAAELVEVLRSIAGDSALVRGPGPCPVSRIANQYRYALDVFAPRAGIVQQVLAAARAKGLLKSDANTAVDVDPVALM
ncbi:MAG TPA: primosomal protein N' [Phycisphaerales bacterium]|nr:primosomal protein N' [Phycisphaerales bacterium]